MAGHLEYFKDRNKIRYSYLEANFDRSKLLGQPGEGNELTLAGPHVSHDLVDIAIGVETFTSQDKKTVTYSDIPIPRVGEKIQFSNIPTVIAVAEDENVNVTIDSHNTESLTLYSSEQYTGRMYWIAVDKVTAANKDVVMILEASDVTFSNEHFKSITFKNKKRFKDAHVAYGIDPIILLSSTKDTNNKGVNTQNSNVNLFISNKSLNGFTINTSDDFTGTVYYLAAAIRLIGK